MFTNTIYFANFRNYGLGVYYLFHCIHRKNKGLDRNFYNPSWTVSRPFFEAILTFFSNFFLLLALLLASLGILISIYYLLEDSALRVVMISFAISNEKLGISPAVGGKNNTRNIFCIMFNYCSTPTSFLNFSLNFPLNYTYL